MAGVLVSHKNTPASPPGRPPSLPPPPLQMNTDPSIQTWSTTVDDKKDILPPQMPLLPNRGDGALEAGSNEGQSSSRTLSTGRNTPPPHPLLSGEGASPNRNSSGSSPQQPTGAPLPPLSGAPGTGRTIQIAAGLQQTPSLQSTSQPGMPKPNVALRTDVPRENRPHTSHVVRSHAYSFVLDARSMPVELGSGRYAKVFLGEERWLESKTDFRREVAIKILQRGVRREDMMRFQIEKELLERVQGHPNIIYLHASGDEGNREFIPPAIRDKVECEYMILERLEMSLEERLKGSRLRGKRDDLLACEMRERIFRVLDYMIPVASAIEYAHLVRNICHRDIKPGNILVRLPDPKLRGSVLDVRVVDFNVAKLADEDVNMGMTRVESSVPGTLFFQSPEQETNIIEMLVNVEQGSAEVEFFEDFYIHIAKNDSFSLFNHDESYPILYADRAKKRLVLGQPYRDVSETNVRAKIQKSVGRPADIYSLGALFYYLISGAYANPKTLYDAFHKFIEYERPSESNTIESYLEHEYTVVNSLRAPKSAGGVEVEPADRFFSFKHYLDGNGDLIDDKVMSIIGRCMIRNKPDSYCQAHDLETKGISDLVQDLIDLYTVFGANPSARPATMTRLGRTKVQRHWILQLFDRFKLRVRRVLLNSKAKLGIGRSQ